MDNKNIFNKEKFANLLAKAKGSRSINRYAEDTNVSAAHISRFLRVMIDAPPTPEAISRLSSAAYNQVSYQDFMLAAGHITLARNNDDLNTPCSSKDDYTSVTIRECDYMIDQISPHGRRAEIESMKTQLFQIMLSYLYQVDFEWNIQKPDNTTRRLDMVLNIDQADDDGYKRWLIQFRISSDSSYMRGMHTSSIYGMIALTELSAVDKFIIVVNSETAYGNLQSRPPVPLRANIYIILLDIHQGRIVKEDKLSSYD